MPTMRMSAAVCHCVCACDVIMLRQSYTQCSDYEHWHWMLNFMLSSFLDKSYALGCHKLSDLVLQALL